MRLNAGKGGRAAAAHARTHDKGRRTFKGGGGADRKDDILLAANEQDIRKGEENGMRPGMIDRLRLTPERIFRHGGGASAARRDG